MRPNVYITNPFMRSFDNAEQFGDLIFLSKETAHQTTDNITQSFKPILEASEPNDYILLTSLTVMNVIAMSLFVFKHNKLNLLLHQAENNSYTECSFNSSDLKEKSLAQFINNLKT